MAETENVTSAHFIGIGGAGMSGIALVLHERGCRVTGSDLKSSHYVRDLAAAGIDVRVGHVASTIDEVSPQVVVTSTAIPDTNPEVMRARELGIPIWPRAKMLSWLSGAQRTVAVAGTHGKTTTSSMVATMLDKHAVRHAYFGQKGSVLYNFVPKLDQAVPMPSHKGYFLFYGRIIDYKGIATLVESMKSLPEVTLKVAGTGPMLEQLKSVATPNVQFVGYKTGQELFELVKNASFIIVPSECEENNPMTIVEGYTYGKPVIGSSLGGIPEIIEQGHTGYVFPAFDREALAQAIRQAASVTDEQYAIMSHNARTFAETHFHPTAHYTALMEIYSQALASEGQHRP